MILVCGEALYDVFLNSDSGTELDLRAIVGGSPYNVAVGLARQGASSAFLSGIADDRLGRNLISLLKKEGVHTGFVSMKKASCSLSIVGIDGNGTPDYTFYGTNAADRILQPEDLPHNCDGISIIHVGSYAMAVEPTGSTLLALIKRESGKRLIAYDPNIRTNVEPDIKVWQARIEEMLPHTHLIKASDEDVQLLYPESSLDDIASHWLNSGPEMVLFTLGSEGATAYAGQHKVHCPGRRVEVLDTVGAGDTLQAALLNRIGLLGFTAENPISRINESDLSEMLEFSVAAASLTCMRKGADLPSLDEIEKFF